MTTNVEYITELGARAVENLAEVARLCKLVLAKPPSEGWLWGGYPPWVGWLWGGSAKENATVFHSDADKPMVGAAVGVPLMVDRRASGFVLGCALVELPTASPLRPSKRS